METGLTGSLTSTAYKLAQNNKRHSQEVGALLSHCSHSENCIQYVIHQGLFIWLCDRGPLLPKPTWRYSPYLFSIPFLPWDDPPEATEYYNLLFPHCRFPVWLEHWLLIQKLPRVNHYNHLENLGVCQNVNYLELISDGLSPRVPARAPLPFLTTMWLLPSAY